MKCKNCGKDITKGTQLCRKCALLCAVGVVLGLALILVGGTVIRSVMLKTVGGLVGMALGSFCILFFGFTGLVLPRVFLHLRKPKG